MITNRKTWRIMLGSDSNYFRLIDRINTVDPYTLDQSDPVQLAMAYVISNRRNGPIYDGSELELFYTTLARAILEQELCEDFQGVLFGKNPEVAAGRGGLGLDLVQREAGARIETFASSMYPIYTEDWQRLDIAVAIRVQSADGQSGWRHFMKSNAISDPGAFTLFVSFDISPWYAEGIPNAGVLEIIGIARNEDAREAAITYEAGAFVFPDTGMPMVWLDDKFGQTLAAVPYAAITPVHSPEDIKTFIAEAVPAVAVQDLPELFKRSPLFNAGGAL